MRDALFTNIEDERIPTDQHPAMVVIIALLRMSHVHSWMVQTNPRTQRPCGASDKPDSPEGTQPYDAQLPHTHSTTIAVPSTLLLRCTLSCSLCRSRILACSLQVGVCFGKTA